MQSVINENLARNQRGKSTTDPREKETAVYGWVTYRFLQANLSKEGKVGGAYNG